MIEKEYIEREALQNKAFGEEHPTFYDGQDIADWYEKCINETPAADVSPVSHGHWKEEEGWSPDDYYYTCSVCGEDYVTIDGRTPDYNFCPHCGAKMDEKEREENA